MARPIENTEEEINEKFDLIIRDIEINRMSLISSLNCKDMPSSSTFYEWLNKYPEFAKRYARACEVRQESKFEEILEIADDDSDTYYDEAGNKRVDPAAVQKKRLQIDARKWQLSKENPKKYGEKIQHEGDLNIKNTVIPLVLQDGRSYEDLKNELQPE